ncbi:hypothetical protein TNCV_1655601 [Trichonephila clavipes]|nr:hypothetical protein TNCV_1655601 [Trichonephila clavipes]
MSVSSTSSAVTVVVWCGVNQIPHTRPKYTIPTVKHGGGSVMSPDLNVIENVWSHLERAVQKHQITSKEQLKSVLQEEWLNIAPKTTRHLVESMPRRLEAVISAKGEKQDILQLAEELGINATLNMTVPSIKISITNSEGYEEEFVKNLYETIIANGKRLEELERAEKK